MPLCLGRHARLVIIPTRSQSFLSAMPSGRDAILITMLRGQHASIGGHATQVVRHPAILVDMPGRTPRLEGFIATGHDRVLCKSVPMA